MRITDSRYDRDRLRLAIAYRMIALEARTRTIRLATQLSDDRIRRMYRDYFARAGGNRVRRRRGKSPRQMAFSAARSSTSSRPPCWAPCCGSAACCSRIRPASGRRSRTSTASATPTRPTSASGRRGHISFEHAWHLWQVFCRNDEFVLSTCPDCDSLWLQDTLEILPYNCPGLPARPAGPH